MLCAIIVKPKKLRDKLQRGHVTRCNQRAFCLVTRLLLKVQRKLYGVTLAVTPRFYFVATVAEIF